MNYRFLFSSIFSLSILVSKTSSKILLSGFFSRGACQHLWARGGAPKGNQAGQGGHAQKAWGSRFWKKNSEHCLQVHERQDWGNQRSQESKGRECGLSAPRALQETNKESWQMSKMAHGLASWWRRGQSKPIDEGSGHLGEVQEHCRKNMVFQRRDDKTTSRCGTRDGAGDHSRKKVGTKKWVFAECHTISAHRNFESKKISLWWWWWWALLSS